MPTRKFSSKEELDKFYESFIRLMGCSKIRTSSAYWTTKDFDPCPTCENERCDNRGKPFQHKSKLIILVMEEEKV
jgi:hypothetical protein